MIYPLWYIVIPIINHRLTIDLPYDFDGQSPMDFAHDSVAVGKKVAPLWPSVGPRTTCPTWLVMWALEVNPTYITYTVATYITYNHIYIYNLYSYIYIYIYIIIICIYIYMKWGVPPNHLFFVRIIQQIGHPFWGTQKLWKASDMYPIVIVSIGNVLDTLQKIKFFAG